MEIRKISLRRSRSLDYAELGHFMLLQRTAKKCTKIYNARALCYFPFRCHRRRSLLKDVGAQKLPTHRFFFNFD